MLSIKHVTVKDLGLRELEMVSKSSSEGVKYLKVLVWFEGVEVYTRIIVRDNGKMTYHGDNMKEALDTYNYP